ncbi:MAG TPA: SRPBCC domain-containing protein [Chloroflexota bacterium]|jgi:uncharacterized protein YndB with AHSA1/START domain|nr:SRPBCC domain-containing protein [Chloroflexota bacterium]
MNQEHSTPTASHRDLVVTRIFDAPVERVWQAWTEPELVMRWWGPQGFTSPLARMDVREGRTSLVCMRSPQGQDLYNTWAYTRIVPLQQIEFIQNFSDQDGNKVEPAQLGLPPDIPQDVRNLVEFRPVGDNKTALRVTEFGYASEQALELSRMGLEQCLDKMAEIL